MKPETAQSALLLILIVIPIVVPAQTPESPQSLQYAQQLSLSSAVLEETREILVSTPESYATGNDRYPVIYLTDGDSHILHTTATTRFLSDTGWIPELIVVAITHADRFRDLTPTRGKPLTWPGGVVRDFPTAGGADRFLDFIETELKPFIDTSYRTQPFSILAGHSAGGLLVTYTMLSRPDLFHAYIAASPALRWDDELTLKMAEKLFATGKELRTTYFMTLGEEPNGQEYWDRFRDLLAGAKIEGLSWEAIPLSGESHPSVALLSYYHGLRKIFDTWPVPRDPETSGYSGGLEGVRAHYQKLSRRYGFEVTPPEIVLNIIGIRAKGRGKLAEAIASYRYASELYPGSAYLFESLGEVLEADGRLEEARQSYEAAYLLGKSKNDPLVPRFKENLDRVATALRDPVE
jgi:predicted alpha/beta superfamily hydrolase